MKFQANASMFMQPADVRPSAWIGHIPFAGWLIEALRPTLLVELGTHRGTSFLAFCQAMLEAGVSGTAYAIDTWEGDSHAGLYGPEVYEELASIQGPKYGGFSKLMRMTFDEAIGYFDDGTIDLLHIDGMHTYEAVAHDFSSWLPKMSSRGVVLFHDIVERERQFGVWKLWEELRQNYPSMEFTHSHGLGVLCVGSQTPSEVGTFFSAIEDGGEKQLVQRMFQAAAHQVELASEVERLGAALSHERSSRAFSFEPLSVEAFRSSLELVRGDIALTYGVATQAGVAAEAAGAELKHTFERLKQVLEPVQSSLALASATHAGAVREASEQLRGDLRMVFEENCRQASRIEALLAEMAHTNEALTNQLQTDVALAMEENAKRELRVEARLDALVRSSDGLIENLVASSHAAQQRDAHLHARIDKIESELAVAGDAVDKLLRRRWWNFERAGDSHT